MELTSTLLPFHLPTATTSAPSPPLSYVQRAWYDSKMQSDSLLDAAADHAFCSPGFGDCLDALPLSSVRLQIDHDTIGIAAGFLLGAPDVRPTCASAEPRLQLTPITSIICLVVTAATTSSTICCVALSQAQAPWRRVSHIHSLCTSG